MKIKIKNRKQRKKRKMDLKKMGLEAFIPNPYSLINGIEVRKMKGYDFIRYIKK